MNYKEEIESIIGRDENDIRFVYEKINKWIVETQDLEQKKMLEIELFILGFSPQLSFEEKGFFNEISKKQESYLLQNEDFIKNYTIDRFKNATTLISKIRYGDFLIQVLKDKKIIKEICPTYFSFFNEIFSENQKGFSDSILLIYFYRIFILYKIKFDKTSKKEKTENILKLSYELIIYYFNKNNFEYINSVTLLVEESSNETNQKYLLEIEKFLNETQTTLGENRKYILESIKNIIPSNNFESKNLTDFFIGQLNESLADFENENIDRKRFLYTESVSCYKRITNMKKTQLKKIYERPLNKNEYLSKFSPRALSSFEIHFETEVIPEYIYDLVKKDFKLGLLYLADYINECIETDYAEIKKTLAKKVPLMTIIPVVKVDDRGFIVGYEDGFSFYNLIFNYHMYRFLLFLNRLKEEDNLVEVEFYRLINECFFLSGRDNIIFSKGISNYFQEDFTSSMFILSTQLEDILRHGLFKLGKTSVNPLLIQGDYIEEEKSLTSVIEDIKEILGKEAEEMASIFKKDCDLLSYVFDNKKGFNFRNKIAHGKLRYSDFNKFNATIILFAIINIFKYEKRKEQD